MDTPDGGRKRKDSGTKRGTLKTSRLGRANNVGAGDSTVLATRSATAATSYSAMTAMAVNGLLLLDDELLRVYVAPFLDLPSVSAFSCCSKSVSSLFFADPIFLTDILHRLSTSTRHSLPLSFDVSALLGLHSSCIRSQSPRCLCNNFPLLCFQQYGAYATTEDRLQQGISSYRTMRTLVAAAISGSDRRLPSDCVRNSLVHEIRRQLAHNSLRLVKWNTLSSCAIPSSSSSTTASTSATSRLSSLPPMEGHSSVVLSHWLLVIGGYARFGPTNSVFARDLRPRDGAPSPWFRVAVTYDVPESILQPCYGLTSTVVDEDTVLCFGGVMFGGYTSALNTLYALKRIRKQKEKKASENETDFNMDLKLQKDEKEEEVNSDEDENELLLQWTRVASLSTSASDSPSSSLAPPSSATSSSSLLSPPSPSPTTGESVYEPEAHAYHSACFHNSTLYGPRLLIFGGITETNCSSRLDIYSFRSGSWLNGSDLCGSESVNDIPSARQSHSGVVLNDKMYVIGGADGADPPRSGDELQHIFELDLLGMRWKNVSKLVKKKPKLDRHHKGVAMGDKIVFVGARDNNAAIEDYAAALASSSRSLLSSPNNQSARSQSSSAYRPCGVYVFDPATLSFYYPRIFRHSGPLFPRFAYAICLAPSNASLYLLHGCMQNGRTVSEVWQLRSDVYEKCLNKAKEEEEHQAELRKRGEDELRDRKQASRGLSRRQLQRMLLQRLFGFRTNGAMDEQDDEEDEEVEEAEHMEFDEEESAHDESDAALDASEEKSGSESVQVGRDGQRVTGARHLWQAFSSWLSSPNSAPDDTPAANTRSRQSMSSIASTISNASSASTTSSTPTPSLSSSSASSVASSSSSISSNSMSLSRSTSRADGATSSGRQTRMDAEDTSNTNSTRSKK